ncbi:MAG: hypothetical protein V1820_02790 [archaeon]
MQGYALEIAGSESPERTAKVLKLLWGETLAPLPLPAEDFFIWEPGNAALLKTFEQVQVPAYILGPSNAFHHYDYPFSAKYSAEHPVLFVDQHTDTQYSPGSIGCSSFSPEIAKKKRTVYVTAGLPREFPTGFPRVSEHHPISEAGSFRPRRYNLNHEKLLLLFDGDCLYGEALTGWHTRRKERATSLNGALSLVKSVRDEAEISGFSNWGFVSWDELTSGEKQVYLERFSQERIGKFKRRTPIVSAILAGACLGKDLKDGFALLKEADGAEKYEDFDGFFSARN